MNASDLLVRCLEEEGIEYIFGVPGEENADFMMALEKSTKIRFILTRHEQGAAFMAEIYGRLIPNILFEDDFESDGTGAWDDVADGIRKLIQT